MHLLGISGTGFFFGTSWTGWDWFKSLLLIDKTSIDISLHMSSGQPRPHSSQNEFQEYFSSDDIPHVCVPLGNWRREELLDHLKHKQFNQCLHFTFFSSNFNLKPDVLSFWEDEIDNGREDEEDGAAKMRKLIITMAIWFQQMQSQRPHSSTTWTWRKCQKRAYWSQAPGKASERGRGKCRWWLGWGPARNNSLWCFFSDQSFCYDQEASDEDVKDEENEGDGSGEALPARIIWLHWLDWWWWNWWSWWW